MKTSYTLIVFLFLTLGAFTFSNENSEIASELVPLSGTYTIGGGSPDYLTIGDAIADLTAMGIDDPVIFNIRDGSYIEQLSIGIITGSSETNTITFQSESQDSSAVVISYDSPSNPNYVFQISNTDYLTFQHLTFESVDFSYGRVFTLVDTVENLTIQNCAFKAVDVNDYHIYGNNIETFNLTIRNCYFEENGYAIHLDGTSNGGSYIHGLLIEDNVCEGQDYRAIYTNLHLSPIIRNNVITAQVSNTTSKIYMANVYDSVVISNNTIDVQSGSPAIDVVSYRTPTGTGRIGRRRPRSARGCRRCRRCPGPGRIEDLPGPARCGHTHRE